MKVYDGGLIFGSAGSGWPLPKVGEAFCAPEESQRKRDWVAQSSKFCGGKEKLW